MDLIDLADQVNPKRPKGRQFSPQNSQRAYAAMLDYDIEVGDYISNYSNEFIIDYTR